MIKFFSKIHKIERNRGMTYVELIVVLSIFSILSTVAIFNYGSFQTRVDIKNLASDIALEVVKAQRSAVSGELHLGAGVNWKPSYGVNFNISVVNNNFTYFADLNSDKLLSSPICSGECIDNIVITKGNRISNLSVTGQGNCTATNALNIVFVRPDSSAKMTTNQATCTNISYAEITVSSPSSITSLIKVYASGRIQVN